MEPNDTRLYLGVIYSCIVSDIVDSVVHFADRRLCLSSGHRPSFYRPYLSTPSKQPTFRSRQMSVYMSSPVLQDYARLTTFYSASQTGALAANRHFVNTAAAWTVQPVLYVVDRSTIQESPRTSSVIVYYNERVRVPEDMRSVLRS